MNGFQPIAGRHEQHVIAAAKRERGFALSNACVRYPSYVSGLNRKAQLLEQCARIGFTPPRVSMPNDVYSSSDVLEVLPCLKKLRRNNMLN